MGLLRKGLSGSGLGFLGSVVRGQVGITAEVKSGTPLQGTSADNPGIQELHDLYKELRQCKAGGKPPPALPDSEGAGASGTGGVASPDHSPPKTEEGFDEDAALMAALGGENRKIDSEKTALIEHAKARLDSLEFLTREALPERLLGIVAGSPKPVKNTLVLIEAPTSKKAIIASWIDFAQVLAGKAGVELRLLVPLQQRLELFGDVHTKLAATFPWMDIDLVQVSRGETQSQRSKPAYCLSGRKKTRRSAGRLR